MVGQDFCIESFYDKGV